MVANWVRFLSVRAWTVIWAVLGVVLVAGLLGFGVFGSLDNGNDFIDPASTSATEQTLSSHWFAAQQDQLLLLWSSPTLNAADPTFTRAAQADLRRLSADPGVIAVSSYLSSTPDASAFISVDGHKAYAAIALRGNLSAQEQVYDRLAAAFAQTPSVLTRQLGGTAAVQAQLNQQVATDLGRSERLSFVLLAVLLLVIFGSCVSGAVPLMLGGVSILAALGLVRLLASVTTVSVYVINIVTLLGLGLAIDYSLLIVTRFKDELQAGKPVDAAIISTLATTGRTIALSALTVDISFISLLVFPQVFLRSMGLGGAAVVTMTAVLALVFVPAVLMVLGPRINAISLPGRSGPRPGFRWYWFSRWVMKQPMFWLTVSLEFLLVLAWPATGARLSSPDASSVPQIKLSPGRNRVTKRFRGPRHGPY